MKVPMNVLTSPRLASYACRSLLLAAAVTISSVLPAQGLDSTTIKGFRWRTIGPSIFEGRVSDIAGIPSPSKTFFVAAAAGGVWKTTNDGVSYRPVFDNEKVASMGALAIAPSDTMQVWAGTGEQNTRNSIEPGGGVYKSTDGGITWKLMGLEKTEQIGRIVIHPTNPAIVYVAALGAAWRTNPERGLYKTSDGGATWKLIKFVSDKAGFIDVTLDPRNPEVVYASSYERIRGPWFYKSGGPGSALWKSLDGGQSWTEIKGGGFPETTRGRINIALAPSNPDIVYACVEADSLPNPKPDKSKKPQKLKNGLYRSSDGGRTWEQTSEEYNRPFYYNQVRVDPKNPDRVYYSSIFFSDDGGRHSRVAAMGVHIDHHALWIDPNNPDRIVVGSDGGIAVSHDKGGNYIFGSNLPIAQFYEVAYDYSIPYRVCAGAQDNGTWCGPSRKRRGRITISDWFMVSGGDGFYAAIDPTNPNLIYSESQGGAIGWRDIRTGWSSGLGRPNSYEKMMSLEDSIFLIEGNGTKSLSDDEKRRIDRYREQIKRDSADGEFRSNWNTPFLISPHSPNVFYAGGNRVMKSTQRGDSARPISPDLSKRNKERIEFSREKTGGITLDATGAETYGTVVALAESYVRTGLLFAGTDDGNVWMTWTDGTSWEQIPAKRFPGLPNDEVYVSRIEPSHFDSLTCYVTFDNHRTGDFTPYVYVTNDGGKNWRSLAATLPKGGPDFLHVVREDPHNRDLLFVGSSVAVYVSIDRGTAWQRFTAGMPTVPVYDLQIHPRDHELIAATHGRGIWIVDINALEQLTPKVLADSAYLFAPRVAYQYPSEQAYGELTYGSGHMRWDAQSPQYGANIDFRLAAVMKDTVRVIVTNAAGDTLMNQTQPGTVGMHSLVWGMQGKSNYVQKVFLVRGRDSALALQRVKEVFDSVVKAGKMTQAVADRYSKAVLENDMNLLYGDFNSFGGGPTAGPWNPRPGEGGWQGPKPDSLVQKEKAAKAKADSAAIKAGKEPLPPMFSMMFFGSSGNTGTGSYDDLQKPLGEYKGRKLLVNPFGLHAKRGGPSYGPEVDTGDFLVTLVVGNRVAQQRVLRVVRTRPGDPVQFTR
jgi:photosystem II stability/assembly factor-like uncharacterized protein